MSDMPPEACEVIDAQLAEFVGREAWLGIAWVPRDKSHPYHQEHRSGLAQFERERRERAALHYADRLPSRYRAYSFTTLRRHPGNQAAIAAAQSLNPTSNLYIWGPPGNGKTHLAVAAGRRFAEDGYSVAFWGVVELFNRTRSSFAGGDRPNLEAPDVLILDDLGKVKPTEFVYEVFYGALEYRWANEKAVVFTANHKPSAAAAQVASDSESAAAVLSRMASGTVVEVRGEDERLPR